MSQADELLNALTESTEDPEVTGGHIVIGKDRFITVPESMRKIAVQYDHDVETVTFDCPRYWDNHDLSEMVVYINYLRPDGLMGTYKCHGTEIDIFDSSIMHFDWTVSGNVTEVAGAVAFLVCIKTIDGEGMEITHWNSELCTDLYVSEGMKCHDSILRRYPDIITQLLLKMDEVTEYMQEVIDSGTHGHDNLELLSGISEEDITNWNRKARLYVSATKPALITQYDFWFKLDGSGSGGHLTYVDASGKETPLYPAVKTDTTLKVAGVAADSATVGTALTNLNNTLSQAFATDIAALDKTLRGLITTAQNTANSATTKANNAMARAEDTYTVDAMNEKLYALTEKLGDIKITRRTDLGDKWLLCNGEPIFEENYPELHEMFRCFPNMEDIGAAYSINGIKHLGGYWFAFGATDTEGNDGNPLMFISEDPRLGWTRVVMETAVGAIIDIAYDNGVWVALSDCETSTYVYVTTDPIGSWTETRLESSSGPTISAIYGHDGVWVAVGKNGDGYPYVYYTTTPDVADWPKQKISTAKNTLADVIYYDNLWIATASYANGTSLRLFTTDDPASAWTQRSSSQQIEYHLSGGRFFILDNELCILQSSAAYGNYLYTIADGVTKQWTAHKMTAPVVNIDNIAYRDGLYYISYAKSSTSYIYTSHSLDGEWTEFYTSDQNVTHACMVLYGTRDILIGGSYQTTLGSNGKIFRVAYTGAWTPKIAPDATYAYIKAKE